MIDVLVVGAGPAGMVAAILLARAGKQVALLDRVDFQRHKIGESVPGMINQVLTQLALQPIDDLHSPINGSITCWGGDRRQQDAISEPQGAGWRLDRAAFEHQLYLQAQSAGVSMCCGFMKSMVKADEYWQVTGDDGEVINARFIVDATGRNAMVAKSQGVKRNNSTPLIAVWAVGSVSDKHLPTARTLIESQPYGWWYAGFLPGNRPICAFHTSQQLAAKLKKDVTKWHQHLSRSELLAEFIDIGAFEQVPLAANDARSSVLEQCYGLQWAACGDAALSFDPLSSQGIFNAIATANLLVKAILTDNMAAYQQQLTKIYHTYQHRRHRLYQQGMNHYQNGFWQSQLG